MNPKISVVMSVYNGEKYLRESIESILQQTFSDFEFIIINDGSTDQTKEILEFYKDSRIRLIHQGNKGLTKSLNKGIKLAKGEYIARQDADDISYPKRFEKQIAYMASNADIALCGTWVKIFGTLDTEWHYPLSHDEISCKHLFENSLAHSSVIIRNSIIKKHNLFYDETLKTSQDYDLWVRISQNHRIANLNELLLKHRLHETNVGKIKKTDQIHSADIVREKQLLDLGLSVSEEELALHSKISQYNLDATLLFLKNSEKWLSKIISTNILKKKYCQKTLCKELSQRWWGICNYSSDIGLPVFWHFINSHLKKYLDLTLQNKIFFFKRCIVRSE